MRALVIAFSMYSRIPMPQVEWNEKNMRYALCCFPFVGVVTGAGVWGGLFLCEYLGLGAFFRAAVAVIFPILVTGGIHMDGFLDTVDAIHSYAEQERRLEILKDPHCGAFAIIYGIVYFVGALAVWMELPKDAVVSACTSFVLSRTLSALSVVSFPLAKNTGLAAMFQTQSDKKKVRWILAGVFLAEILLCLCWDWKKALAVIAAALFCFGMHYECCRKKFGGITGDLAGFFLQMCELLSVLAVLVVSLFFG